jgi:hypothetical protein
MLDDMSLLRDMATNDFLSRVTNILVESEMSDRQLAGDAHDIPGRPWVRVSKDIVDLFQRAIGSLGVQKVHNKEHEAIHDGEDDIGVNTDAVEGDGRNHHDHEIECPIGSCTKAVDWSTNFERHNLCRIQPRDTKPSKAEECIEKEDKERRRDTSTRVASVGKPDCPAQDCHRAHLTDRAKQEQLSSTDALNSEDSNASNSQIGCVLARCHDPGVDGTQAYRVLVDFITY